MKLCKAEDDLTLCGTDYRHCSIKPDFREGGPPFRGRSINEGAPSFAVFAKGGYNEHLREWLSLPEPICIEECT